MDLRTSRKFARGSHTAIPGVNLHLKPLRIKGFCHEILTQRVEAAHCCTNVEWICWVVVRLDEDPLFRNNTLRPHNYLHQCSYGIVVGDLSGATVETNGIGILFCDRHFPRA